MTGSLVLRNKEQVKRFRFLCGVLLVPWLIALVVKWNIQILQTNNNNKSDVLVVGDEESSAAAAAAEGKTQQQQQQQQPLLVLHLGPGKTGTTGLQVDLTKPELQESLGQDGYWYAGRYYNNTHLRPKDGHLDEGKESFSPLLTMLRQILIPRKALNNNNGDPLQKYCKNTQTCWKVFRNEVDQASKEHKVTNIVLSDEPLALRWSKGRFATLRDSLITSSASSSLDSDDNDDLSVQPQQHLQHQLQWKPLVVVSYRRFYEWLPSSIYQRNRKRLRDTEWPSKGDLHALELLWPHVVTQWRDHHYTFMDSLVDQAQQAGIEHRILNIHLVDADNNNNISSGTSGSIRTEFLCHVLPNAPSSCATSRQMDELVVSSAESNNNSISNNNTSSSTSRQKRVNVRDQNTIELLYQDMITTQAADQGLIQQRLYSRTQVREALRENLQAANQTARADLEQYCPTRDELDVLYQQSLDMEVKYILPTLSSDRATQQQWVEEHRKGFDQMVASNAFCILNLEAAVRQLRDFFEQYSK